MPIISENDSGRPRGANQMVGRPESLTLMIANSVYNLDLAYLPDAV